MIIQICNNLKAIKRKILRINSQHQHQLEGITNSRTDVASMAIGTLSRVVVISKSLSMVAVGEGEITQYYLTVLNLIK